MTDPTTAAPPLSVCVYCGSRPGTDAAYAEAARQTGLLIGQRGWQLVYGGGKVGLMGIVANAVLEAGGRVVGVIPRKLMEREVGHTGLSETHIVDTMHQRKQLMAERADAFLALPGGIGTLEELFEVWTWRQIGYHDQPIGLLNVNGFYDGMLAFLKHTVQAGFLDRTQVESLHIGTEPAQLLDRLRQTARSALQPDRYQDI
jgi:uncharacterized protein (TIGR00730 family)